MLCLSHPRVNQLELALEVTALATGSIKINEKLKLI